MKKPDKNSLSDRILEYLRDTSKNLFNLSVDIVFNPEEIVGGLIQYRKRKKYYVSRDVSHLKHSPYFTVKKNEIYLNEKGRIKIIKSIIKDKKKDEKWDGKWWAIIFDIPEINRRERGFLRKELKWMKFRELQHSVWITPLSIEKELLALLKLWRKDFRGDIRFLRIEKIIKDDDLKKNFDVTYSRK